MRVAFPFLCQKTLHVILLTEKGFIAHQNHVMYIHLLCILCSGAEMKLHRIEGT